MSGIRLLIYRWRRSVRTIGNRKAETRGMAKWIKKQGNSHAPGRAEKLSITVQGVRGHDYQGVGAVQGM